MCFGTGVFRDSVSSKDHTLNKFSVELMIICVHRFCDDGTPVAKHVGIGNYHELCFMNFDVLLSMHLSMILVINQLNAQNLVLL